jgi:DNA-directed RNA polymerase specialized sigma24 family protein
MVADKAGYGRLNMQRDSLTLTKLNRSITLDRFNAQVQACQDEVYNLAYYFMGNVVLACEIVDRCFGEMYKGKIGSDSNFRMLALQLALRICLKGEIISCLPNLPATLNRDERIAVLLVDCLQYSYQEAALICSKDISWVSSNLAAGRCHSLGLVGSTI